MVVLIKIYRRQNKIVNETFYSSNTPTPIIDNKLIKLNEKLKELELKMEGLKDPLDNVQIKKVKPNMNYMDRPNDFKQSEIHYLNN